MAKAPRAATDLREALLLEPPREVAGLARRTYVILAINSMAMLVLLGCFLTLTVVLNPDPPSWAVPVSLLLIAVQLPLLGILLAFALGYSVARTIVTRQGLICVSMFTRRLPWPTTRSSFYPVVRRFSNQWSVAACQACNDGQARQLPGVIHIGTREQIPQMLAAINAQLDEVWTWGIKRGCTTESGLYRELVKPKEEQARRQAAALLEDPGSQAQTTARPH